MVALSLETWISFAVLVTALSGFYIALRRELRAEVSRLEGHVIRLDDRVYALAVGVKPLVDQAQESDRTTP